MDVIVKYPKDGEIQKGYLINYWMDKAVVVSIKEAKPILVPKNDIIF